MCIECGLVRIERIIDTSAEWRTFIDSDHDPNRCGSAMHPLLTTGLSTMVEGPRTNVSRAQSILSQSSTDALILEHMGDVDQLCHKMGIGENKLITDRVSYSFCSASTSVPLTAAASLSRYFTHCRYIMSTSHMYFV